MPAHNRFENPLPGIPNIENPFFDQIFGDLDPPAEILRIAGDLRQNGFAVIDFPDPDIMDRAERIKRDLGPQFDRQGWLSGTAPSQRVQDAWRQHPDVRAVACNRAVLDLLGALYGRAAFPFQTLNFFTGSQQRAHSDSLHFSSDPERWMCGVWLALEDIDDDNGPLLYYPGSHVWRIFDNACLGIDVTELKGFHDRYPDFETTWERIADAQVAKPQYFHARKGQALIWAANLLRGGDRHRDRNRTRWSQVTHYLFEGCGYYTPLGSDVFRGRIALREPYNILTGKTVPNSRRPPQPETPPSGARTARRFLGRAARRLGLR